MILLGRNYNGYLSGTIVQLDTPTETALVQQGFATISAGPVTPGPVSTVQNAGRVGIATGGTAVTVSNPNITPQSKVSAFLSNPAADANSTSIRVTPALGQVTFTLNAASAGVVAIDWSLENLSGLTAIN